MSPGKLPTLSANACLPVSLCVLVGGHGILQVRSTDVSVYVSYLRCMCLNAEACGHACALVDGHIHAYIYIYIYVCVCVCVFFGLTWLECM